MLEWLGGWISICLRGVQLQLVTTPFGGQDAEASRGSRTVRAEARHRMLPPETEAMAVQWWCSKTNSESLSCLKELKEVFPEATEAKEATTAAGSACSGSEKAEHETSQS